MVVFTAVLLLRNLLAWVRLTFGSTYKDVANASHTRLQSGAAIVTQVIAWSAGVAAVYLTDIAGVGGDFTLGGKTIPALGFGAKVMIGLMAASTLSAVNEIKKALDNTDSARAPALIGDPTLPEKPR